MTFRTAEQVLVERFDRAKRNPPLLMLYPPVSTGRPYQGAPGARTLWGGSAANGTLYVHVPFCRTRCVFCPFYAVVAEPSDYARYAETLLAEAALLASHVRHIAFSSVYIGGGTPSVFPPALVDWLIEGLGRHLRIEGADVSLEAHPATMDRRALRDLRAAGVTRLSLGVQSFDPRVLEACGRGDTADRVLPALDAALDSSFRDVNVDLMYGLPAQSRASWMEDLRIAAAREVPGLTLYATVYLPVFRQRCEAQGLPVSSAEDRHEMYAMAHDYLDGAGYPQPRYGAGAFLRGGLNPHRRNVALGLPMLGLGTWAYSSNGSFAWHNRFPTADWAREVEAGRLPIRQLVEIRERERARKWVIEALLLAYVSLAGFRDAFGKELAEVFPEEIAVLARLGLAGAKDGELRLTREGGRHLREIRYLFASEDVVDALESGVAQGL